MTALRRSLLASGLALGLVLNPTGLAAAAAGDLDDTFDDDGKTQAGIGPGDDRPSDVAIQPGDQKIVVVGRAGVDDLRFAITRFMPNGELDATFAVAGFDGRAATNVTSEDDEANAVALQADGKIVVVGRVGGGGGRFGVVRYDQDGELDTTFSSDGFAMTDFGPGNDIAWDVAVQPADQKIVVAGGTSGSDPRFAVVRYLPNGALDGTFSGDGKVTANLVTGSEGARSLAIHSNGRIVAAGVAAGSGGQIGMVRFTASGAVDASFGANGKVLKNLTGGPDLAREIAIQPADQRIVVVAGQGLANSRFAVLRYRFDGTLDNSFNFNGIVGLDITTLDDEADALALQTDGKIVVAGTAAAEFFAVVRLTSAGALDTTFGDGGAALANFGLAITNPGTARPDTGRGVALQADGNIVVAGSAGGVVIGVARFLGS